MTYEDVEFTPVGLLRVITENSVWLVADDRYQRMPRVEGPRPLVPSIGNRLADGRWHQLRRCWWRTWDDGWRCLRLLPAVGAVDGVGVVSGVIVAIEGAFTPVTEEGAT